MNIMLDMHMHRMHKYGMTKLDTYLGEQKESDAAFGAKVGLSQSQISRIRRGVSKPSWGAIIAIEKATDGEVTASDWFSSAPDAQSEPAA